MLSRAAEKSRTQILLRPGATGTERRIHEHRVELLLCGLEQPQAVGGIIGEETLAGAEASPFLGDEAPQRLSDSLLRGLEVVDLAGFARPRQEILDTEQDP